MFSPDPQLQMVAEAYYLDARDQAAKFGYSLDGSDSSIAVLESFLDRMHREMAGAQPSPKVVMTFAKMFGSYVGEVYRRNHGAQWGATSDGFRLLFLSDKQTMDRCGRIRFRANAAIHKAGLRDGAPITAPAEP